MLCGENTSKLTPVSLMHYVRSLLANLVIHSSCRLT